MRKIDVSLLTLGTRVKRAWNGKAEEDKYDTGKCKN